MQLFWETSNPVKCLLAEIHFLFLFQLSKIVNSITPHSQSMGVCTEEDGCGQKGVLKGRMLKQPGLISSDLHQSVF